MSELLKDEIYRLEGVTLSQLFGKDMHGNNLGTPVLKPYKRTAKLYQNDTILQEKPI